MRGLKRAPALAVVLTSALLVAACGGNGEEPADPGAEGDATEDAAAGGGNFSIYVGEPENPLVPGNTTESEGNQVIYPMFTGLIEYDVETSEALYTGVAESIESEDSITWTVTLNDGWTFHNGDPVTASSFVDAWNYTAFSPNAYGASYFFSNIEGYDALQAETDDAGEVVAEPTAEEMSGLEVVSDTEFTVTLASPFTQFPVTTGYTAFYPLPEAFFEDPDAFGEQPIGNGPFMATEPFVPGQGITLARYDDYAGENAASAEEVEIRVYSDISTGYTDVQAGNLDILPSIPPDAITSAPDLFGDRYIERPSSSFTYMGFPTYDERFADPTVRQAFSLAVDREAITEAIFNGSREPAHSVISPVVDGSRDDACEYCFTDVDRANELLDESGFDRSAPVELWFNSGAGHDQWVQAVGNQLRDNLGIEYTLNGSLDFAQYLPLIDDQGMTGPFRLGWIMDYPSPQNFLEPLYTTQALPPGGSNATFYSNPEFDELVAMANAAESNEEAIELYQQAEDVLLQDMPVMPMFFGLEQAVHSERVSNVAIDAFGRVDMAAVTVNE